MQVGRHACDVIHDDDRHSHVGRKVLQETNIRIEATGRAANADNREISHRRTRVNRHRDHHSHRQF